jgi:hypothetical protein
VRTYIYSPADWLAMTLDLTPLEDGMLHRLVDWASMNDALLPTDLDECCRITRVGMSVTRDESRHERDSNRDSERHAVTLVVSRFTTVTDHGRVFAKPADITRSMVPRSEAERVNNRVRQQRIRDKKRALVKEARILGEKADPHAPLRELEALVASRGVTPGITRDPDNAPEGMESNGVTVEVTVIPRDTGVARGNTNTNTNTEIQLVPSALAARVLAREGEAVPGGVYATPTRRGLAGLAIAKGGLKGVNLSDPRLDALLAAGVTDDELQMAATEATARGKGWGYCLGIVRSRREEAGRLRDAVAAGAVPPESAEARVAQWAPALAAWKP